MAPGVHRVRRQSWRVAVRSAPEAFAARLRLRTALESEVPFALQRAFDRAAPDDAPLHIPRLELRLRVPNLDVLAEALAEALEAELALLPHTVKREAPVDFPGVLLAYLDTGSLAWHAAQGDPIVAAAVLRATLLENLAAVAQRGPAEKASLAEAVQFYFRLLALLPAEKWPQLAPVPNSSPGEALDAFAVERAVSVVVNEDVDLQNPSAAEAIRRLRRSPQAAIAALVELRPPHRHRMQRSAAIILAAARLPQTALPVESLSMGGAPADEANPISKPERAVPEALPKRWPAQPEPSAKILAAHENGAAAPAFALMTGNAGLVLLHPFLPRLFQTCELFRPPRLTKIESAAALLHWLATGRDEVHEFELGFVKLLLGLHPETPLPVGEGLVGPRERDEGKALLDAAISHWKALGKSSPDALRVAFLQRRGALREEEAGWRLQPEPEAYDVLLGRLPWGFATVKLPWMTRPLYTDWPTP